MKEKDLLRAIIECKCPQCRKGDLFTHSAYNLKKFSEMPEECPNCGLRYEREPGFFYGAMYVSYALSVGIFLATVFVLYVIFNDPDLMVYITIVAVVSTLLYPLTLRYSRVIFMNIFGGVDYNPAKAVK